MFLVNGSEFGVNETDSGTQAYGQIAALGNGNYAVVYSHETYTIADPNNGTIKVEVRILDNNGNPILGNAPLAHEIVVSTSADRQPVIASVAGGGFIVAWTEVLHDSNGVISGTQVRAQTYDANGYAVGQTVIIDNASDPSLSTSGAGHVLVYQTSVDADGVPDNALGGDVPVVEALTLGTNGVMLGTVDVVRGTLDADGYSSNLFEVKDVGSVGTGYAVIYQSEVDIDPNDSFFEMYSYVRLNGNTAVHVDFDARSVAATGNGNFVVVGLAEHGDAETDVVAQMFWGSTGQAMGDPFTVNSTTDGTQNAPSVSALADGSGFVVVWADEPNAAIGGQAFDPLGQAVGTEFVATLDAADTGTYMTNADVASDAFGNIMVTWTGWDASGYGVRGEIFSNQLPAAFFAGDADTVDFNHLSAEQQQAVDDAASGNIDSVYNAGEGDDTVVLPDAASAQITAHVAWDYSRVFSGGAGNDHIQGGDADDIIAGDDGDDSLDGNGGNDSLRGGTGNDTLRGGAGADLLSESSTDAGPFGNDVYNGGAGSDRVSYFISNGGGVTVDLNLTTAQNTGQGTDTLLSIEHITATYGNDTLIGNEFANWFWTFSGNDTLTGNGGNDYFTVGDGNKVVSGGSGIDTLEIAEFAYVPLYTAEGITVTLATPGAAQSVGTGTWTITGVENLGGFNGDDDFTGDDNVNVLAGHIGNDTLIGGGGNDSLYGDGTWALDDNGNQILIEDDEADGPGGNDVLDGGTGGDRMVGGRGNDTYRVDDAHDVVVEYLGEGTDRVQSSISYTLGTNVENLALEGAADLYAYGNGLDNVLTGNAGANKLFGLAGNDDLDGGAGIDRLAGGTGDDTYYVDAYADAVVENAGEGTDSVFSTADYTLRANVENLTLTGSAGIWGYGNDGDNNLTGNSGSNKLFGLGGDDHIDGGTGADRMWGGLGDDVYTVDNYSDRVIENAGEGTDSVFTSTSYKLSANVENLTITGTADLWAYGNDIDNLLTGNDGSNKLYGLAGSDTLSGGNGSDWLEGGAGQDHLTGGAGADSFVFRNGDFAVATVAAADEITDFTHGEDHIRLNYVDANSLLTGDQAFAFMGTSAFDGHAGELRYEQISGNTYVEGDTNGDGIADFMIRVDGLHTLTSGDFAL